MTSQTKVQAYLAKYKIQGLFETLMSSLIKEMPPDPFEYIITIVRNKKRKRAQASSKLSHSDATSTTSVWASTTNPEPDEGTKSTKKTDAQSKKSKQGTSKKDWDKTVKMNNKKFDDLSPGEQKPPQKSQKASSKPHKKESKEESIFASDDIGNKDCLITEEEFLADELLVTGFIDKENEDAETVKTGYRSHPRYKGPKAEADKHKKELAEYIDSKKLDSNVPAPSDKDENDDIVDSAISLAENPEDLEDEGVFVPDHQPNQIPEVRRPAYSEPTISVSICGNCAKIINGSLDEEDGSTVSATSTDRPSSSSSSRQTSQVARSIAKSHQSEKWKTHRTNPLDVPSKNPQLSRQSNASTEPPKKQPVTSNRPHDLPATGRTGYSSYYAPDDDDEFESVSQVSGDKPRIPVWSMSDDEGDIKPVKSPRDPKNANPTRQNKKASVTLRDEILRQLPQSSNTVEEFLDRNAWSGGENTGENIEKTKQTAKKRVDVKESLDTLMSDEPPNWQYDINSDDESVLP